MHRATAWERAGYNRVRLKSVQAPQIDLCFYSSGMPAHQQDGFLGCCKPHGDNKHPAATLQGVLQLEQT